MLTKFALITYVAKSADTALSIAQDPVQPPLNQDMGMHGMWITASLNAWNLSQACLHFHA